MRNDSDRFVEAIKETAMATAPSKAEIIECYKKLYLVLQGELPDNLAQGIGTLRRSLWETNPAWETELRELLGQMNNFSTKEQRENAHMLITTAYNMILNAQKAFGA